MTKLIYTIVLFLCKIFALVFGFLGIALIFIIVSPYAVTRKFIHFLKRKYEKARRYLHYSCSGYWIYF